MLNPVIPQFRIISLFNSTKATMCIDNLCRDSMKIFKAGVDSVQPKHLIIKEMKVKSNCVQIQGKKFPLSRNVYIVGFGKAVLGMALEIEKKIKDHLITGILSIPEGMGNSYIKEMNILKDPISCLQVFEGASKNIPDENSLMAASKISELVSSLKETDLLFILISGGGSALLPAPKPPLTLQEKQKVITSLVCRGATIEELNAVRKPLSLLKGGGLAKLAKPAKVISLILSDIIGDPLGAIASGPTFNNTDDPKLPLAIIEKYNLKDNIPNSALKLLQNVPIEVSSEDNHSLSHVTNFILGNNQGALEASANISKSLHYTPIIMTNQLKGTANIVGKKLICLIDAAINRQRNIYFQICDELQLVEESKHFFYNLIEQSQHGDKHFCLLFGGETTVEVHGTGIGGRNQELALSAAMELSNKSHLHSTVLLSAGTDGIDGPTSAAGALATNSLVEVAKKEDLDPVKFLENNDSYNFFSKLNNGKWLIKTGHTGTNVMDIIIILTCV